MVKKLPVPTKRATVIFKVKSCVALAAPFWVITQRVVAIPYWCFGTTCRSHPQGSRIEMNYWTLRMGPIGCPKTSVRNYHYSLPINSEERSSQLLRGGTWNHACNALLHMLLVCISIYLKSVLRYNVLILDTHHPDTLYWREQWCEDPWLFFEAKRGPRAKKFGKHCVRQTA